MPSKTKLERLLEGVFRSLHGSAAGATVRRHDFVFHMTDWKGDLKDLHSLFTNPAAYNMAVAKTIVCNFLVHAPAHMRAAERLLLGSVSDPFLAETCSPAETKAEAKKERVRRRRAPPSRARPRPAVRGE